LTTYKLIFRPRAKKSWDKLDSTIRNQLGKRLSDRLRQPRISSASLSGMQDCYKIKLRSSGYRLVYKVYDDRIEVLVLSVGKRERNEAYADAQHELKRLFDD
jgi:mRNA interferase RelE/StbE